MKKSIAFLGSLLLVFGLKAQTTHPAKKETTKQVAPAAGVPLQQNFTKKTTAQKAIPQQTSPAVQGKAVQSGKRR